MAELDEAGDEPNSELFGSFGHDVFSDGERLLTETDVTEQTEIGQLNDEDIDNFIWLSCCLHHSHRQNQDILDTLTRK